MRALIVGHTYVVDVNQHKLACLAASDGLSVGLLVPRAWKSADWRRTMTFTNSYAAVEAMPVPVVLSGIARLYGFRPGHLRRLLSSFRPDIVQIEQEVFTIAAFQVARSAAARGIPYVVLGHENLDRHLHLPPRRTRDFVLRRAAAVIATNRSAAALISDWGYTGRIEVLPQLGVDTALFQRVRPSPSTEGGTGLTVGYVGRLVAEKGVDTLLRALARPELTERRVRAMVCGDGPAMNDLRQLALELQLDRRVTFLGARSHDEVADTMRSMDVVVLPSRTTAHWKEQFGHVLVEAMAMGIPVIGSSSGAIPEVIGRPELLFPEGNEEALANRIVRLCHPRTFRNESDYCFDRCMTEFRQEVVAERNVCLWRDVLAWPGPDGSP